MAHRYSIAGPRTQLSANADLAAAGHEVGLTRRGEPTAAVISTRSIERLRGRKITFPEAYQRFVKKFPAKGFAVDKAFARSLRDRSAGRDPETSEAI